MHYIIYKKGDQMGRLMLFLDTMIRLFKETYKTIYVSRAECFICHSVGTYDEINAEIIRQEMELAEKRYTKRLNDYSRVKVNAETE